MTEHMLSTSDNPFNPWVQWDEWFAYDTQLGHHTTSYLARIVVTSDELSEPDQAQAIEDAIDEIVGLNLNGLYIKVPEPEG